MYTKSKILESVPCKEENSPAKHGLILFSPFYIADSISYLRELILSSSKQNKSLIEDNRRRLIVCDSFTVFDNTRTDKQNIRQSQVRKLTEKFS